MEYREDPGALHLYVGEEAVRRRGHGPPPRYRPDHQHHTGHGHLVAKGGDLKRMYAELFGRATGYCKEKAAACTFPTSDLGMLGAIGIVGAGPPIAIVAAFSNKYRGRMTFTCCFFGDGASNEGTFTRLRTWLRSTSCGDLHLRKQRLRRVHPPGAPPGNPRHRRPGRRLRMPGSSSMGWTRLRCTNRPARPSPAPAAETAPPSSNTRLPLLRSRRSARPWAVSTRRQRSFEWRQRDPNQSNGSAIG